jgi:hypothetical protein
MTLTAPELQRGNGEPTNRSEAAPAPDVRDRSIAFRLPHGLLSARFGLTIGAALVAGLVALLAINTSLAAGAIEVTGTQSTLARTTERQQALQLEVDQLSSPAALQQAALTMGMVPAAAPAFLDPTTGAIAGALAKADAAGAPQMNAQQVTPPAPAASSGPAAAPDNSRGAGLEPEAQLVMPPDPGADGAVVTRPPVVLPAEPPTGPPIDEAPSGDAAALVSGTP